jgi:cytochrome c oxidase assembly protein subunit 15
MRYPKVILIWLYLGLILVFLQIVIGGVTRLTGSGLSITEWDIVTGTLPPMNEQAWISEFEKYKVTPQYEKINEGMSLSKFKFIYFWEYFHRLWARMMGFCFLLPFIFFCFKGYLDSFILKRLGLVIFFAALAAVFGWIMVASGLVNRPWVNAYKLSIHLSIGIAVFISLLWTLLDCFYRSKIKVLTSPSIKKWNIVFTFLFIGLCVQIIFGGIVSGMRAALPYPTWPDMNGVFIPEVLLESNNWNLNNFINYEASSFAPGFIQFLHRNTAYALMVFSIFLFLIIVVKKEFEYFKTHFGIYIGIFLLQTLLGILTLINSIGSVPVYLGVLHQGVGVLLLASNFVFLYTFKRVVRNEHVTNSVYISS